MNRWLRTSTWQRWTLGALALLALASAARIADARVKEQPAPLDASLDRRAERWVAKTLEGLSLDKKVAQMLMVQVTGRHHHPHEAGYVELLRQVRDLGVGGVIVSTSEVHGIPALVASLGDVAELPLIVASDLERSLAFRVRTGVVPMPFAMAVGATRSVDAARFLGAVTAGARCSTERRSGSWAADKKMGIDEEGPPIPRGEGLTACGPSGTRREFFWILENTLAAYLFLEARKFFLPKELVHARRSAVRILTPQHRATVPSCLYRAW